MGNTSYINYSLIILLQSLVLSVSSANAKDFGVNGNTYKIVEEPFIQMIENRAKAVDVEQMKKKMQDVAKRRVENPIPVSGITSSTKTHTFYHDPTYVLERDVVLPCGKILHRAGASVNPLEHMELMRRIIFIDARKPQEMKWLKEKLGELDGKFDKISDSAEEEMENIEVEDKKVILNKIILVGGGPLKLQKDLDMDIYFDQKGFLTKKWGIKHSPAIVEQEGKLLKITEYKVRQNDF